MPLGRRRLNPQLRLRSLGFTNQASSRRKPGSNEYFPHKLAEGFFVNEKNKYFWILFESQSGSRLEPVPTQAGNGMTLGTILISLNKKGAPRRALVVLNGF